MDLDLRRFDGFMSEPERDHRVVDAMVQQLHRGTVSKHVRADSFSDQDGHTCDAANVCFRTICSRASRLSLVLLLVVKSGSPSAPAPSEAMPPTSWRFPSATVCSVAAFVNEIWPPSDAEMWPPLRLTDISCLNAPGTDDGGGRSCETVFGFARTGGRALASTGPAASTASAVL